VIGLRKEIECTNIITHTIMALLAITRKGASGDMGQNISLSLMGVGVDTAGGMEDREAGHDGVRPALS
jgi:hypothetical protein